MYKTYRMLTLYSGAILSFILDRRCKAGKEIPHRLLEKKGISDLPRPPGLLLWIHAASVGEAQSALILVKRLLALDADMNILVTTGTLTSSQLMDRRLPREAFHQFFPLDHPKWVEKFVNHWQPNAVIWMESELWPNMLNEIRKNNIPAILVNAHMSEKSFSSWKKMTSLAKFSLSTFSKILCQTETDQIYFNQLGAKDTLVTDNLKYSADPLDYIQSDLNELSQAIQNRPLWLYASTHKGEETIACNVHKALKSKFPELLTIIVPRHPERREEIKNLCRNSDLKIKFRGKNKTLPDKNDDIYIVDTLGELGLFYRLSPIACIGRSFSDDGGGGHNPIEAAQLNCAILHGPNVQNLQNIFDDMNMDKAALCISDPTHLCDTLNLLLSNESEIVELQTTALKYSNKKNHIIENIMNEIKPILRISGSTKFLATKTESV
ncbi:MAG: 3-deoxy-D-manno-octulosonic acid transferase [Zetaproteobacteria bacterium]|nr:MAG: 3-deoxy-D-manno-octulosonic acid transferase [Zetaproteobacteria bacterium]